MARGRHRVFDMRQNALPNRLAEKQLKDAPHGLFRLAQRYAINVGDRQATLLGGNQLAIQQDAADLVDGLIRFRLVTEVIVAAGNAQEQRQASRLRDIFGGCPRRLASLYFVLLDQFATRAYKADNSSRIPSFLKPRKECCNKFSTVSTRSLSTKLY